mmetsp:Transcript_14059/g.29570  ORF Transcript_14059/g.29570 Transcript_14059/m.29570 type:complete len:204 (+) Transcript_14059:53-664(+)
MWLLLFDINPAVDENLPPEARIEDLLAVEINPAAKSGRPKNAIFHNEIEATENFMKDDKLAQFFAFLTPLLYLSPAARSLSLPARMIAAKSTFAPKTMYLIVGPRKCTQSKFSPATPEALVDFADLPPLLPQRVLDRTRFINASASRRRPLKVRPFLVSTMSSIPTKCRRSGARLEAVAVCDVGVSDLFGCGGADDDDIILEI